MNEAWKVALLFCMVLAGVGLIAYAKAWRKRCSPVTLQRQAHVIRVVTPSGVTGYIDASITRAALEEMARQLRGAIHKGSRR